MPATLSWKPTVISAAQPMLQRGALATAPYATRREAVAAVAVWQHKHPGSDSAFLVTPGARGGWVAQRFSGSGHGEVDAKELTLTGAGALHPQSFVIDARGRVARPDVTKPAGEVSLREVHESSLDAPVPQVGSRVLPLVPATPQVNHGRNVTWSPTLAFRPGRDIEQLADIMKWVAKTQPAGTVIKAGGSRHAWSKAAASDGVYLHPEGMGFIELAGASPLESLRADLPAAQRSKLVRAGAGTTIRQLNADLWSKGLALPVLGGFDGQTLAGVLPTGTHGSVLSHGPLAELVRSIDLVKPNGDKVRIEPAGGPTDAAAFARTHPGWSLMQEDATFDAALVNLGTFGVVHSYLLETREKFYLNEVRTKTTGREAREVLRGGNVYDLLDNSTLPPGATERTFGAGHPVPAFHLELLWNPHTDSMLVTSRHPVELDGPEPAGFGRPTRDLVRTVSADPKFTRPKLQTVLSDHLGGLLSGLNEVLKDLAPSTTPGLVDGALDALVDGQYTQRSYNVFNIGDGANLLPAQSATLSVPLRDDQYLRALDIMRKTADTFSREHGQYQTGPISLRFVKGSRAALGDPEDVCKLELIFSGNGPDDQALAKALTEKYYAALHAELGDDVRFHWGQIPPQSGQSVERLRAAFPRFDEFNEVRRRFDPDGVMLNPWQRQLFAPG
ncbi:MAG: FAD-binding protein [Myxococcaceae bacterium]|nr:FAD-binding protein [Myxococcaceae bacterium]